MGVAIGSQSILGISAFEGTFGTATAVDRWYEFTGEGLTRQNRTLQSQGLRPGYLPRGTRRVNTGHSAAGDLNLEVAVTGFSRVLQWIFGGTPVIAQQGGTAAYLHTHTMGSLLGKSANVQKVLRDSAGTEIDVFTYRGTKVASATFSIAVDSILTLGLSLDAREELSNVASVAASYTSPGLFHFQQAALTVAGSPVAVVSDATITIDNNLNVDRRHLGNTGLKSEQSDDGFRNVTGSFTSDIDSATLYDLHAADTAAALVLSFTSTTEAGTGYPFSLTLTVPEVHLTGTTPTVGGPGTISAPFPFEAAWDGTNSPIKAELVTTDTAV